MFRINTLPTDQLNVANNVSKIKAVLGKTINDVARVREDEEKGCLDSPLKNRKQSST